MVAGDSEHNKQFDVNKDMDGHDRDIMQVTYSGRGTLRAALTQANPLVAMDAEALSVNEHQSGANPHAI